MIVSTAVAVEADPLTREVPKLNADTENVAEVGAGPKTVTRAFKNSATNRFPLLLRTIESNTDRIIHGVDTC